MSRRLRRIIIILILGKLSLSILCGFLVFTNRIDTSQLFLIQYFSKPLEDTQSKLLMQSFPQLIDSVHNDLDQGHCTSKMLLGRTVSTTQSNHGSRQRIAVIIPFRNRKQHLKLLLPVLHSVLQRQGFDYEIILVEQAGDAQFNKGRLMNCGFLQAIDMQQKNQADCIIFHDVDLIPLTSNIQYSCSDSPRHLSVAIDSLNYTMPYSNLIGGVLAITADHFELVNGFSNLYWGWGGEDDDLARRFDAVGLKISRPSSEEGRFHMLHHLTLDRVGKLDPSYRNRLNLVRASVRRYKIDGLSSIRCRLVSHTTHKLYQRYLMDVSDD